MALQKSMLESQLVSGFSTHNDSAMQAATKIANAFDAYIKGIQNLGGGTFSSMAGISLLNSQLNNIFLQQLQSGAQIGDKIATAFNQCMSTLNTIYQTAPPITSTSFAGFKSQMMILFQGHQNSGAQFARKLATHIHTFVSTSQIQGVVPGSPPVPFTGPPS